MIINNAIIIDCFTKGQVSFFYIKKVLIGREVYKMIYVMKSDFYSNFIDCYQDKYLIFWKKLIVFSASNRAAGADGA